MTREELKESRLRMGLSQKAMAEALNTPYRTYQDWELGNRRIPGIVDVAIKQIGGNKMTKFNVYTDDRSFQTEIEATDMNQALDLAAKERGPFIDHADMCLEFGLSESDLNIVEI